MGIHSRKLSVPRRFYNPSDIFSKLGLSRPELLLKALPARGGLMPASIRRCEKVTLRVPSQPRTCLCSHREGYCSSNARSRLRTSGRLTKVCSYTCSTVGSNWSSRNRIHMHCLQSSRLYTRDKSIEHYGNSY